MTDSGENQRILSLPGVEAARAAAARAGVRAYLVGGAVRDALLGAERADLDLVVEGDHLALARELGEVVREHDRFRTATVETAGGRIDIAATRGERYEHPGALPETGPGTLDEDLARRDFSVNAIAYALGDGDGEFVDPHHGRDDLERGLLRTLHPRSLLDDPTRALRAARYAARLDFGPDAETEAQIRAADLATVSSDRVEAELRKLAREPRASRGFELLDDWGLVPLRAGAGELIAAIDELARSDPWVAESGAREAAIAAAARGDDRRARALADARPQTPSERVAAAHGLAADELLLARALGAQWLDHYLAVERHLRPAISGQDLIDAGVPPGPAIGRGLAEATRVLLDEGACAREQQLAAALRAARNAR